MRRLYDQLVVFPAIYISGNSKEYATAICYSFTSGKTSMHVNSFMHFEIKISY